jgi:type II secretory pathway pseudopilin PulG
MAAPVEFRRETKAGDEGFMLLFALVMVFLVLLTLSIAAPRIAKAIQRDREQESAHRAQQYVRAVRIFYLKFKRYPTSMEQLEKTNNQRFLRQRYIDPLTGKDDWRLIHVGENQTTVKGFFGDELPGLPTGLGSAAGLSSTTGGGSAFNNSGTNSPGGSAFGGSTTGGSAFGGSSTGSAFGGTTAPGAGGLGQTGTGTGNGTGTSGSTSGTNGVASQDATSFTGSGGGPIIGIGSSKSGEAMLVVNEQATYETWEFLYDPRIEQLYAKTTLLGGIASGSGTSGFGSSSGTGTTNGFGNPSSLGFGSGTTGGTNGTSGTGTPTGTGPTSPTGTTPP